MRILIVEDEIREGLRKLLKKIDSEYEIVGEASDGKEGFELCESLLPDCVITDVQMPIEDGLKMLQSLHDKGVEVKAIVISAYSEFEYARSAMRLGVTEYILKPININEVSRALDNVKSQIEEDKQKKPEQIGTLEQIMRELIGGRIKIEDDTIEYLKKNYKISEGQSMILIVAYLGNQFEEMQDQGKKDLNHVFSLYGGIDFCILEAEHRKSLLMVVYHYNDSKDLERWIQYQAMRQLSGYIVVGFTEVTGIRGLKTGLEGVFPYMDWNISFESDILISYPKITQVQTHICVYPQEIETQTKSAICAADSMKEKELLQRFSDYFRDGRVYDPREIKECFVRFIWAVLDIAKDVGNAKAGEIKQQSLLEQIMNAKTRGELSDVLDELFEVISYKANDVEGDSLIVRKAKSMIHEFYHTGITLDEIASRLNITPEYLGTQFHKETGATFSTYIKNHRISKAKELLVGTSLKLYEISDRVGYSDPKYFSKVFKDVTGQLPAEYRKTFK